MVPPLRGTDSNASSKRRASKLGFKPYCGFDIEALSGDQSVVAVLLNIQSRQIFAPLWEWANCVMLSKEPLKEARLGSRIIALGALYLLSGLGVFSQTTYYGPDNSNGTGFGTAASFTWDTSTAIWNTDPQGKQLGSGAQAIAWVNGSSNNAVLMSAAAANLTLTLGTSINVGSVTTSGSATWTIANSGNNLTMNTGSTTGVNLTLNGGTFSLAATGTYTFNTITFSSGTTILDFGNSIGTTLQSTNLVISPGASVTVNNWVAGSDAWKSTNAPTINGVTLSGSGATVSNVTFSGSPYVATWNSTGWSNQIAAVPEPSTYGIMLIGSCAGLMGWRRWRSRRETASEA